MRKTLSALIFIWNSCATGLQIDLTQAVRRLLVQNEGLLGVGVSGAVGPLPIHRSSVFRRWRMKRSNGQNRNLSMTFQGRLPIRFGMLALALAAFFLSSEVFAHRIHRGPFPHWGGNIARFHEHDWNIWRSGHWNQVRHNGRFGWWWVVGNRWYSYPVPVYPYPNPWEPPTVALANPPQSAASSPPPTQYWYYCQASMGYYPYIADCPGGWMQVPAKPVDALPTPILKEK